MIRISAHRRLKPEPRDTFADNVYLGSLQIRIEARREVESIQAGFVNDVGIEECEATHSYARKKAGDRGSRTATPDDADSEESKVLRRLGAESTNLSVKRFVMASNAMLPVTEAPLLTEDSD